MPHVIETRDILNQRCTIAPVEVGQVYRFAYDCLTRAGEVHEANSLLIVQASTTETPHGEISESGCNWVCKTSHGVSCWATLENCIARGLLRLERGSWA